MVGWSRPSRSEPAKRATSCSPWRSRGKKGRDDGKPRQGRYPASAGRHRAVVSPRSGRGHVAHGAAVGKEDRRDDGEPRQGRYPARFKGEFPWRTPTPTSWFTRSSAPNSASLG